MSEAETSAADYEAFVEQRLRVDFAALENKRDGLIQKIDDYDQFLASLRLIRSQNLQSFTAQAPLGMGVSVEATVPNAREVFVHVGLGCYVACSYSEAIEKVTLLKSIAESQLSEIYTHMGKVRSTMEFMTQSIEALHFASTEENV